MLIQDLIRIKRTEKNLTMKELADKVGVSEATISRWESGEISNMKRKGIIELSKVLDISPAVIMEWEVEGMPTVRRIKGVRVPVLGSIVAGMPLEAIELRDEDEWEEIHPDLASTGDFFALRVKGSSMEPKISEGDIVIVRQQPDVDTGSLAVVLINGNEATLKKVTKHENGIMLTASNVAVYEPHFYSREEIENLPVQIIGKVVELRAKFE